MGKGENIMFKNMTVIYTKCILKENDKSLILMLVFPFFMVNYINFYVDLTVFKQIWQEH